MAKAKIFTSREIHQRYHKKHLEQCRARNRRWARYNRIIQRLAKALRLIDQE